MPREVFEFSCPCCGKRVELDTRTGKARAVRIEESKKGKTFEDMVSDQGRENDRLSSAFDHARADHAASKQTLDDLFSEAKEASERDREARKKPPHPFLEE